MKRLGGLLLRLLQAATVGALALGCGVPTLQHEQAVARASQERAGRDEAERVLADTKQRLSDLERRLEQSEQSLSQTEYSLAVALRERDDAQQLVDQLRGELDRIARDLRGFGEQNRALATLVGDLEKRVQHLSEVEAEADERAQLLRDLAMALRDDVADSSVTLTLEQGVPVVRLSLDRCFDETGQLTPAATRALQEIAQLVAPLSSRVLEITAAPTGEPIATPSSKLAAVTNALSGAGLPPPRTATRPPAPGVAPGWVVVTIRRVKSR